MKKEELEQTLNECAAHFKQKLLIGDFIFESCDEYKAFVLIDGYRFSIWIANVPEYNLCIYFHDIYNVSFPILEKINFNDQERRAVYENMKKDIEIYRNNTLLELEEKIKMKEKIEKEIDDLSNQIKNNQKLKL